MSIWDGAVAVGAPGDNDYQGAVYIYEQGDSAWTRQTKLTAPNPDDEAFGSYVSLRGNTLVSAATGQVYVFKRYGADWIEQAKLPVPGDESWGHSISTDGARLIAGSPSNDDPEPDSGSAFIFDLRSLPNPTSATPAWALYR